MSVRAAFASIAVMIASVGQSNEFFSDTEIAPVKQFNVGTFLEGIVFDSAGYGYVSAVREGAIHKFQPGDSPILWAESASPNGHKVLPDGSHVIADRTEHGIVRFNANGERQGVFTGTDGISLKAPNDIALDTRGEYYFTDMRDSFRGGPNGEVHHVDNRGKARIVATELSAPNGLVLSPDGKTLYVSESRTNHVLAFSVMDSNLLKDKRIMADLSNEVAPGGRQVLDGIAVDSSGIIYVAYTSTGAVYAISSAGEIIRRFPSGMKIVANVAFDPSADILYMVGSLDVERTTGSVFTLDLSEIRRATQ